MYAQTLTEAVAAITAKRLRARELADAQLARVRATEPAVQAWTHLDAAYVQQMADEADRRSAAGALRGAGIGIKDIIDTAALPTEIGSAIHRGRRPAQSAACVARLEAAGGYV